MLEKLTKNLIPISIAIAGLLIVGAFVYTNQGEIINKISGSSSSQVIAEKAIKYINEKVLSGGNTASLVNVSAAGDVYKIHLKIGDQEYDSYVTRDGKFLFPDGYNLEEKSQDASQETTSEVQTETQEETNLSAAQLEVLAKCLTEKESKFYGAYWCSWCNKEKELFGAAAQYLPYVECSEQETRQMTAECEKERISSFPTWEFNGEKNPGFKSLDDLIKLSGCSV